MSMEDVTGKFFFFTFVKHVKRLVKHFVAPLQLDVAKKANLLIFPQKRVHFLLPQDVRLMYIIMT